MTAFFWERWIMNRVDELLVHPPQAKPDTREHYGLEEIAERVRINDIRLRILENRLRQLENRYDPPVDEARTA